MSRAAHYVLAVALAAIIAVTIGAHVAQAIGASFDHLQTLTQAAPH
jgi:hypothetical protein